MLRSRIFISLTVVLSIGVGSLAQMPSPGKQRQLPAISGNISVSGTVVNSVTNEPIARALVQLNGIVQRVAMTDSDGKFQFEGLPETQAAFMARKPGYFSDMELQRGGFRPTAITAGMGSITVKLTPAGVITGHISNSDGEPIEYARVRLKMRAIQNGRRVWQERSGASTDEDGSFRISNLRPGTYYLFADGAFRSMNTSDEAYAPAYYPGAADISGASPVDVRPGSTNVVDMTLRKETAYRVSGTVTGLQPGQNAMVQLFNSGNEPLPVQAGVNPGSRSFEIRRVPAGVYTLKVIAQLRMAGGFAPGIQRNSGSGGSAGQNYSGSVPINVSGDLTGVTVAVQPDVNIPIVVRTEFTNKQQTSGITASSGPLRPNQFVNIRLARTDGQPGEFYAQPDGSGESMTFSIRNVEPGRYRAEIMQTGGNTYVQSASYGTTDILRDELVVSGSDQPIDVTLRDDVAYLSGTANCQDAQCWVIIVPDGSSAYQPRVVYVNPQGTFQTFGLAPGSYRVYAFDRTDGIEFTNPDVMKSYGSKAETVVLSAGQKSQVNLELTKVADQ